MTRRIFLVEDSAVVRESYALLFEVLEGYEVCGEAESGEDALAALDEARPDILVVDVALPGMSGIELVREVRERKPELPVVLITGHDRETYGDAAQEAGARAYVMKHEGPKALVRALREIAEPDPARPS